MERPGAERTISPMWLAHHYPEDYDRCLWTGRNHVCRRCIVIWPVAFFVLGLALVGVRWPSNLDVALVILLPVPAVIEFVLEHLGVIEYHAVLQMWLTVPMAVALGIGFDRYLHRPTDPLFWGVTIGCSLLYFLSIVIGARLRRRPAP
jgi:hypothetical protein